MQSRKWGYFIFARHLADRNHWRSLPQRSQHILEHAAFWSKITFGSNREQRKPMLLLVFVGSFLLRLAERTLLLLLFHVPPRSTPPVSLHHRQLPENAIIIQVRFSTSLPITFQFQSERQPQNDTGICSLICAVATYGSTNAISPTPHLLE